MYYVVSTKRVCKYCGEHKNHKLCKSTKHHHVDAIKIYCTTPCYTLKDLINFLYSSICSLLCYSGRILWQPLGRSYFYLFIWWFHKTLCFLNYVQVCLWYCTHILSGKASSDLIKRLLGIYLVQRVSGYILEMHNGIKRLLGIYLI